MAQEAFLVDANIFLEMLLRRQRAEECRLFFERMTAHGTLIALTTFALYSIEINLEGHGRKDLVAPFLQDCKDGDFLLVATGFDDENEILLITEKHPLDFDDAHQYWAAKKLNAKLVSFDADFDKTAIKRWEPAEILKDLH